jgi:transketolase
VKQSGAAVSVEDHQAAGGLGGVLSETFAKNYPIPMEFIGLQDTFGESGPYLELLQKYHMDERAIVAAVKKVEILHLMMRRK